MSNLLTRFETGYCNHCGRPAFVAALELPGWKHKFSICLACLQGLVKQMADALGPNRLG
jgi:hypothetical protein